MENLLSLLQSADTKARTAAVEAVQSKLRVAAVRGMSAAFGSECKADVLVRLMSNCVSILKEV